MRTINAVSSGPLSQENLYEQFDLYWPKLEHRLQDIPERVSETPQPASNLNVVELVGLLHEKLRDAQVPSTDQTPIPVTEPKSRYLRSIVYAPASTMVGSIFAVEARVPDDNGGMTPAWTSDELRWVIAEVSRDVISWNASGFSLPAIFLEMVEPDVLNSAVLESLTKLRDIGCNISLGISERWALHADGQRLINQLHDQRLTINLIDFGTGYSSLSKLKELPIKRICISDEFVRSLGGLGDADDKAIVSAIVELSKHLKLETIAQGVHTQEQATVVAQIGVTGLTGNMAGRAMTADQVLRHISGADLR